MMNAPAGPAGRDRAGGGRGSQKPGARFEMLRGAGLSERGRRASNEDRILTDVVRGLFVVADGMGGENCGEVAAELAVEAVSEHLGGPDSFDADVRFGSARPEDFEKSVAVAVEGANRRVRERAAERAECAGMGTTLAVVAVSNGMATVASVGDSRAYRLRSGQLLALTSDDLVISGFVAAGKIHADQARNHPMKHVLSQAVGARERIRVDVKTSSLEPGDRLVLCSDGLHGVLTDEQIRVIFDSEDDLTLAVDAAVRAAYDAGGADNISCICVEYE